MWISILRIIVSLKVLSLSVINYVNIFINTNSEVIPSFVLMDVQGGHVILYVYQQIGNDVKVEKLEHSLVK